MDIHKSSVMRVLNIHLAGKEEKPKDTSNVPVSRRRYYYFRAPAENSIKFTALSEIMQNDTPERDATIKKLQGGNSGRYYADYFSWQKVAIVTNEFTQGSGLVVYECDLSPIGSKIVGSEKVTPSDAPVDAAEIEDKLLLFDDKRANSGIINVDKTNESYFLEEDAPQNISKILMSGAVPAGHILTYDVFSRYFDEYRIWIPNINQLLLPDFEVPKSDDVPGGHYVGGQAAYDKLVGPVEKSMKKKEEETEEPSLGEKIEEKTEEKEVFEPVGEKPVAPEKGEYMDTKTAAKKKDPGDYASEPYSGGTDVMQRLVKDQRKKMNIRKQAQKVAMTFIKEAQVPPATTTTTTSKSDSPSIPISSDPKENVERSKIFKDIADKQEEIKKMHQEVEKVTQSTTI